MLMTITLYAKEDKIGLDERKMMEIAKKLPEDLENYQNVDFIGYFGNEESR